MRKPLWPKRRLAAAVLLFTATFALLLAFGHPTVWRYSTVAAAVVVAAVYGSIPLWPPPSTVRNRVLRPKAGVVQPSSPTADALRALAAPILVAEFLVAVITSTSGPQWLWWVVAGLFVAVVAVLLLSAWLTLPLVPPKEQL